MSAQDKQLTVAEGAALIGKPEEIRTAVTIAAKRASFVTSDEREDRIGRRFKDDTARHQLTVLKDDGLYRHLRFKKAGSSYSEYWFDLVTWPGTLVIRGDVQGYMFSRLPDMFEFFRADRRWGINPHYWAEKLEGGRRSAQEYSQDLFRQLVAEHTADAIRWCDAPRGIGKAVRTEILNQHLSFEEEAREVLEAFEYEGFSFEDTWEWDFHDYERSFLWAAHAIQWGIARYDKVTSYGLKALATPEQAAS